MDKRIRLAKSERVARDSAISQALRAARVSILALFTESLRATAKPISPTKHDTKTWRPGRKRLRPAHGRGNWQGKEFESYALHDARKRKKIAEREYLSQEFLGLNRGPAHEELERADAQFHREHELEAK